MRIGAALLVAIVAAGLLGCQSGGGAKSTRSAAARTAGRPAPKRARTATATTPTAHRISAHVNGEPISRDELLVALTERAGGPVLTELILDRQVRRRLTEHGLQVTPEQIDGERLLMQQALHADADQGRQLLSQLRDRRGLGKQRFARLLERNAGLRQLVQDEVEVKETDVRQAYDILYGPRYEARLIVVDSAGVASRVAREARAGRRFVDLVRQYSTDPSRANAGLIGPISPADPTYPRAIRQALSQLEPGGISPMVALEGSFALLKLVNKTAAQDTAFADVEAALAERVRRQLERRLMERLARTLVEEANVVIRDRTLRTSWDQHRQATAP